MSASPASQLEAPAACPAMHSPDGDGQLLARLRAGDGEAFELLVRTHGPRMLRVARRLLACESEGDDAVQDAFLSAFRSLDSFRGDSQLATWLHRITVNTCLMRLRGQRRRPVVRMEDVSRKFDEAGHRCSSIARAGRSPHELACRAELQGRVRRAIDQLPESYREILLLRDIEGFDTVESATFLGVSESVIKTRLHRARQALRTMLQPLLCG